MGKVCGLLILSAAMGFAAIDGTAVNGTTGKPAAGVSLTLVQPSQDGMKTLGSTTADASGNFTFQQTLQGPGLLQATYQGVTYTKMLAPGTPTTGVKIEVFDATSKPVAKVAQHVIIFQPTGTDVNVTEMYVLKGDPTLTYNDPKDGTLHFYVPSNLKGEIGVQATAPGGMPVQRAAEKTKQADVYMVGFPIKPGETRIDVSYALPAANPDIVSGKLLYKDAQTRLVAPNGVTLKGDNLTELGKEPQTQATIYDVQGDSYKVEVAGTVQQADAAPDEDNGQPQIREIRPQVYNQMYVILGITFAMLGLGTFLLARKTSPR